MEFEDNQRGWQSPEFWSELLIMIGIALLSAVAFTFISYGLLMAFFGYEFSDIGEIIKLTEITDKGRFALIFMNSLALIGTFLVSVIAYSKIKGIELNYYIPIKKEQPLKLYVWSFLLFVSSLFVMSGLVYIFHLIPAESALGVWADGLEKARELQEGALLKSDAKNWFWILMVGIAVVPAIAEEVFFRGWLMHLFKNNFNWIWGLGISSMAFALVHFNFYNMPAYILIAVVFGLIVLVTKNILFSVILHFINNAFAVYLSFNPELEKQLSLSSTEEPNWIAFAVGLVVFSLFFYKFYQYGKANNTLNN